MPETIHDILRESLEVRIAFSKQLAKIATRIRQSAQTAQASSHIGVNEQMERDLPQGETLNTTNTYKQYTLGSLLLFKHVHTASPLHNVPQLQRHFSRPQLLASASTGAKHYPVDFFTFSNMQVSAFFQGFRV